MSEIYINEGLGVDEGFYVTLPTVTLVISKKTMFKLGLAFYHISVGNWELDGMAERVEVADLRVYQIPAPISSISSKSPISSNHQNPGQNHTLQGVNWLLFETRPGAWLLALLERALGLAVVDAGWLGQQAI